VLVPEGHPEVAFAHPDVGADALLGLLLRAHQEVERRRGELDEQRVAGELGDRGVVAPEGEQALDGAVGSAAVAGRVEAGLVGDGVTRPRERAHGLPEGGREADAEDVPVERGLDAGGAVGVDDEGAEVVLDEAHDVEAAGP
jgi:hypothetical protein